MVMGFSMFILGGFFVLLREVHILRQNRLGT
jgi:hypothetical protein